MTEKTHRTISVSSTHDQAAVRAANVIAKLIHSKPNAVISLATGDTQLPLYAELVRMHRNEGLDFSHAKSFMLDEYYGLERSHPASFDTYLRQEFLFNVNIPPVNIYMLDGYADGFIATAKKYEESIQEVGGLDLQILGVGENGHIGFNEPGSSFDSRTRIVELAQSTRLKAAPKFNKSIRSVPGLGLTMGIATIMEARKIVMAAAGDAKAEAVQRMIVGEVTPDLPASVLQRHPDAHFYFDRAAAMCIGMPGP